MDQHSGHPTEPRTI